MNFSPLIHLTTSEKLVFDWTTKTHTKKKKTCATIWCNLGLFFFPYIIETITNPDPRALVKEHNTPLFSFVLFFCPCWWKWGPLHDEKNLRIHTFQKTTATLHFSSHLHYIAPLSLSLSRKIWINPWDPFAFCYSFLFLHEIFFDILYWFCIGSPSFFIGRA